MSERNQENRLYLVIPCYNEEEVLSATAMELECAMTEMIQSELISSDSKIVFIDDGSRDQTWKLIETLADSNPLFCGIALGHNVGHQNALYAGLMMVKEHCHFTISMDADLQDDPNLLPQMVQKYVAGYDIVCTVRKDRNCDSFVKKTTAGLFYSALHMLGADIPKHGADFRLLSRDALEQLAQFKEHNPFLRGLIPQIGLPTTVLSFDRAPRRCGKSKYSFRRMMSFAADGIFSLSRKPLDLILIAGILCFAPSFLWLMFHVTASAELNIILASIWSVGGLILIALGILGQYIGRIYIETLNRPRYTICRTKNLEPSDSATRYFS